MGIVWLENFWPKFYWTHGRRIYRNNTDSAWWWNQQAILFIVFLQQQTMSAGRVYAHCFNVYLRREWKPYRSYDINIRYFRWIVLSMKWNHNHLFLHCGHKWAMVFRLIPEHFSAHSALNLLYYMVRYYLLFVMFVYVFINIIVCTMYTLYVGCDAYTDTPITTPPPTKTNNKPKWWTDRPIKHSNCKWYDGKAAKRQQQHQRQRVSEVKENERIKLDKLCPIIINFVAACTVCVCVIRGTIPFCVSVVHFARFLLS